MEKAAFLFTKFPIVVAFSGLVAAALFFGAILLLAGFSAFVIYQLIRRLVVA